MRKQIAVRLKLVSVLRNLRYSEDEIFNYLIPCTLGEFRAYLDSNVRTPRPLDIVVKNNKRFIRTGTLLIPIQY